jgi:hypothetical protein
MLPFTSLLQVSAWGLLDCPQHTTLHAAGVAVAARKFARCLVVRAWEIVAEIVAERKDQGTVCTSSAWGAPLFGMDLEPFAAVAKPFDEANPRTGVSSVPIANVPQPAQPRMVPFGSYDTWTPPGYKSFAVEDFSNDPLGLFVWAMYVVGAL